ncbi:MAG: DUF2809 domain-containing protein [Spirulina sp. SIO3F2]|nr:DUF2809 domain-containing protein [Spirulina sp. SIO3F2]
MTLWRDRRFLALSNFLLLIPIGLGVRFYTIPNLAWLNDLLGSVVYEIAWCLLGFALWPQRQAVYQVPIWVFGLTCVIEFAQLWHPAWLDAIRATLPGRLILGNTFVWLDFSHYALGAIAGWLWLKQLWRWSRNKRP